ncbi:MAG: hypothetical protein MR741_02605 [Clostridiales bacterium]|nr:hypothetical protein [Clostridiales bacterium]MDD7054790.1 hypothetical protein [Clostridiales bacterium]MDY5190685.1 hypothetical protein [Eubacteriales bacterium]
MAVEKHALNKKERALMHVLLNLAEKNDEGVCLVKPLEIFEALPYDYAYTPEELEPMLKGLALDDYLEYISADNHGELTYCITMHQKGLSFARVERAWRKSVYNKLLITVCTAIVSGTIAIIIRYIITPLIMGKFR